MTLAALLLSAALPAVAAPAARDAATNDPGSLHALMDGSLARARAALGGKVLFMGAEGYFPGSSRKGPSEIWRLGWERPGGPRDYRSFKCEEHLDGVLFTPDMKKLEVRAECTLQTCTAIDAKFIDAGALLKKLRAYGVRPNSRGQYWALLVGRNCPSKNFGGGGGILRERRLPDSVFDKMIWIVNNYEEVVLLDAENGSLVHRYESRSQ